MKMGIDISTYQNGLNLKDALKDGIEFVIIRGGFTGSDKTFAMDNKFIDFYNQAKENNIPVGVYYYSRATNFEEGKNEAEFLYEKCLKNRNFEYPIYIDVEDRVFQEKASKEDIDSAIKGFCSFIESKGGYVGVYCNLDWADNHMNYKELSKTYDFWLADWNRNRPNIDKYDYGMWQFGGSINLIRSDKIDNKICDQDYAYKDYPSIMKDSNLNNFISNVDNESNSKNNDSFKETIKKELVNDTETEIENEINENKGTIFKYILNLFKKIIAFFFVKLK